MADKVKKRYLFPEDFMADPSVHVFDGKLYIYPSHDWESAAPDDDFGSEYDMKDYHVLSLEGPDPMTSPVPEEKEYLFLDNSAHYLFWMRAVIVMGTKEDLK